MLIRVTDLATLIIALSFAGYPLVASISALTNLPNTPMSIVMRGFLLALAILILVHSEGRLKRPGKLALALLAILILYGLRLVFQTIFVADSLGQSRATYWIWYFGTVLFPVIAVMTVRNFDDTRIHRLSFLMFILAAVPAALIGSTMADVEGLLVNTGRAALTSLNPISLGHLGASLSLLCLWSLFGIRSKSSTRRGLYILGLVLGFFLIFMAASRGPVFAISVALFIMGFSLRGRQKIWFLTVSSTIIGLMLFYLLSSGLSLNVNFIGRLFSVFNDFESDGSNVARAQIYMTSIQQIGDSPFLGSSIENTVVRWDPHNLYLEFFMAIGIPGGILPIIILPMLVLRAARLIKVRHVLGGIALLYIYYFVSAQFSGNVYSNGSLWVSAMVVAMSFLPRQQLKTARFRLAMPPSWRPLLPN